MFIQWHLKSIPIADLDRADLDRADLDIVADSKKVSAFNDLMSHKEEVPPGSLCGPGREVKGQTAPAWVGLSAAWAGLSAAWAGLSAAWAGLYPAWAGLSSDRKSTRLNSSHL